MWLPAPVYERLPVTYGAAGACGLLVTHVHPLAVVSAILFAGAAVWTVLMRREYRGFYGSPEAQARALRSRCSAQSKTRTSSSR